MPGDWLVRRAARGDSAVRLRLGRQRLVYLLGPAANAAVFGHDERFRAREAFAALEIVDGPTSVVLSDGADHARRRGLIRPAVAPRRIDGYLETMAQAADEALAEVLPGEPFDAYVLLRRAIRRSTLRVLFGGELARRADEVGEMLQPLLDLTDKLPQVLDAHRRLRTPAWRRAMTARAAVDEFVNEQVRRERDRGPDEGVGEGPMLPLLVHGRDGAGSGLDDQEVRDQAVTMIAAGYETTSAAIGWIVYLLGTFPDWQVRAREEVTTVLAGGAPGPGDLDRLAVLRAIVTEALRLYPPAMISVRYAVEGFEHDGEQIRPGDLVVFSPYATHRDAQVYSGPLRFDPGRWLQQPRRAPEEYLPFGGGKHRCLGSGLAMAELTVMLSRLLAHGEYRLDRGPRAARGFAAMRPHPGVRITIPPQ
ncbi:cytochrome P450 [Ruania albidiflava]|uniref:cytochrome P450 n=1 Tax=Ruania albidiflava TaxID=366586 RepID=UPI0023F44C66|nr:cytochrome P450 [Ruania albidiflava]